MDTQITVKEESCVNHEIRADMFSRNTCDSHVDLGKVKQERVQDETSMGSECEPLHQENIFEDDTEYTNVELKLSPVEVIIKNEILDCNALHKGFNNADTQHMRTHTGVKPFECEICKRKYTEKLGLQRHMRLHTGEKPFECDICKQKFADRSNRRRHMKKHTGEKPFECDICKKRFAEKSHIQRHIGTHTRDKLFECGICSKKFAQASSVPIHMNKHTGVKFECEICKKKYNARTSLLSHIYTHTGEKLLQCPICKTRCITPSKMREHMRTHTKEKPYACDICKKKFRRKRDLLHHMRKERKSDKNNDNMYSPIKEEVHLKSEISGDVTDNLAENALDDHSTIVNIKHELLQTELQQEGDNFS